MMKPFEASGAFTLQDLPDQAWLWFGKAAGALLGSAISIAYVLPKNRREAFIRFVTGIMAGLTFGSLAGAKIVEQLGLGQELSRLEIVLMGSTAASLSAWSALGILHRLARRHSGEGEAAPSGKEPRQ